MALEFAMQATEYDMSLQGWLGTGAERYLFSVMSLEGNKRLYTSPYDYEKYTHQLVHEDTVERWRQRLAVLAAGKWPRGLPETREWKLHFPEKVRAELLEEKAYDIPVLEEEEEPETSGWW